MALSSRVASLVLTLTAMSPWRAAAAEPSDAERAAAAIDVLAAVGTAGLPADAVVVDVDSDRNVVVVGGSFFSGDPVLDSLHDELLRESLMGAFDGQGVVGGVLIIDASTGLPLGAHLHDNDTPATRDVREPRRPPGTPRPKTATLPFGGALVGKRIAISAGHGWLDNGDGSYSTQRSVHRFSPTARGIVEDFFSTEFTTNQLLPLLQGMGAEVIPIRVPDHDDVGPPLLVDITTIHVRHHCRRRLGQPSTQHRRGRWPGTGAHRGNTARVAARERALPH